MSNELTVFYREQTGKSANRRLRYEGFASGIIYGIGEPTKFFVNAETTKRWMQNLAGQKLVKVHVEKNGATTQTKEALLQEYQFSNVGQRLLHIDFHEVKKDTLVRFEVPLKLVGNSKVIKLGGIIQVIRRSIPVKFAVKDFPECIEVDVTELNFGQSIHVLDIEYPKGVVPIVTGKNFTLATAGGKLTMEEPEEETEEETEETEETKE